MPFNIEIRTKIDPDKVGNLLIRQTQFFSSCLYNLIDIHLDSERLTKRGTAGSHLRAKQALWPHYWSMTYHVTLAYYLFSKSTSSTPPQLMSTGVQAASFSSFPSLVS